MFPVNWLVILETWQILFAGKNVSIYCHGMNSSMPEEFVTLPTGEQENYSEIYGMRHADGLSGFTGILLQIFLSTTATSWFVDRSVYSSQFTILMVVKLKQKGEMKSTGYKLIPYLVNNLTIGTS